MASFADLLLTGDVPAVDLSGTSRRGTDDARGPKDPLPAQSWRRYRVSHGRLRDCRAAGSDGTLARERRAVITRIYEGTSQTQRVVTARRRHPLRCLPRSGWRTQHETRWGLASAGGSTPFPDRTACLCMPKYGCRRRRRSSDSNGSAATETDAGGIQRHRPRPLVTRAGNPALLGYA
jgi:hypothetical protein